MLVPGVVEVAVVAKKHPMLDEVPIAFVRTSLTTAAEQAALIRAIEADCAAQLADFKRPREIKILEDFPRSTLEKIAKAELRKMLTS